MNTLATRFDTDVPGIWGHWPTTPALWSYSSLKEMEACPRRWMLSRATYPDVWDRRGYPQQPVAAGVFGNVVHGVVERLAEALADAGIKSASPGAVIGVLGEQGGWRGIVLKEIDHQLARFDDNPRVSRERIDRLREELIRRAPQAADQVKTFLGRGALPTGRSTSAGGESSGQAHKRLPVTSGTRSEREVCAEELRLTGRIDLLVVDDKDVAVVDFKTGDEDPGHADQVRLSTHCCGSWTSRPIPTLAQRRSSNLHTHLTHSVEPPDSAALDALQAGMVERIAAADEITAATAWASATPSVEGCQFCQVKHLCDTYWPSIPPKVSEATTEEWFDFEGRVLRPQGSRSWFLETDDATQVLVRTVETNVPFPEGDKVRLLGVRRTIDPDKDTRLVIAMVSTSEWYAVSS